MSSTAEQIETLKGLLAGLDAPGKSESETNREIAIHLCGWCAHEHTRREGWQDDTGFVCEDCGADSWGNRNSVGQRLHDYWPPVSSSIDAALALVSKVIPGTMWATGCMEGGPFCRLVYPTGVDNGWGHVVSIEQEGGPASEPMAILSALLSAKLALLTQEKQP